MNSFNLDRLVRPIISNLEPYSSARDEFTLAGDEMIFLDANENPYQNGVNRYPDPQQSKLKEVLALRKALNPNQMLLGNGSDEVLDLLFRAFCEPNKDAVITLPPTYGMYKVLSGINAITNIEVQLTDDYQPDVERVLQQQDATTKLLFLCSPNNPTGTLFSPIIVEKLVQNFKGIVVIDEAYIDFSAAESWVGKLNEYPNLVVTQTFSKAYGMAGIRLGVCYASEAIIAVLNKIKPPYNVNELTQQKAMARLKDSSKIEQEITSLLQERDMLSTTLNELPFVDLVLPSEANFILARVDDAHKRYQQLLQAGIVVRNRSNQPLCDNTLRFTVGTPKENKQLIYILQSLV